MLSIALQTIFVVLAILIAFIAVVWNLAKRNPATGRNSKFFTFIEEGTGAAVMRGESLHKILISLKDHHLKWVTVQKGGKKIRVQEVKPGTAKDIGVLQKWFGLYWMGIWPFIKRYLYGFAWGEWPEKPEEGSEHQIVYRHEPTDFFYIKTFAYAVLLKSAEAVGNVRVDVKFTLFVRIVRPQIALFWNVNWLQQLVNYVLREARVYTGGLTFDELRREAEEGSRKTHDFSPRITVLNNKIDKDTPGTLDLLGVEIVDAKINEVDIAGDEDRELTKATTARYVAEERAKARIAQAEGDTKYFQRVYRQVGRIPGGKEMFVAEAIRDSSITVLAGTGGIMPAINVDSTKKDTREEKKEEQK